jgi:hypothetical protein
VARQVGQHGIQLHLALPVQSGLHGWLIRPLASLVALVRTMWCAFALAALSRDAGLGGRAFRFTPRAPAQPGFGEPLPRTNRR